MIRFYHLSHTDLDGYGCQLITNEYFKDGLFYNANYGLEVTQTINKILDDIKQHKDEKMFLLISDLNLTFEESKNLQHEIDKLNLSGFSIRLKLLDHHGTGQKCANKFDWYYLDTSRSATKIVYDYFCENFGKLDKEIDNWLYPMVDIVNAVDLWLQDQENNFEFGKVCMRIINHTQEINHILFADENRKYRLNLLKKATMYLDAEDRHIALDDNIHRFKKEYLQDGNSNNTLDNLSSKYLVKLLNHKKDDFTIYYKGHKGLLTYTLGSISIPANEFLNSNSDYDFFMDISRRGAMSLRADGKLDVSLLAQKLANGGGHPNASGGKFKDFNETINYNDVKNFIETKIEKIE
jgi:oligoribonuclease NrnB/cAMP/cGMP phosphodiesterase (DHH superfamily)